MDTTRILAAAMSIALAAWGAASTGAMAQEMTKHVTPVDPNPVSAEAPMLLHSAGSTDLFTGAYTRAISIPLPPARNGFVPSVVLAYNSEGEAGFMGAGWSLSVPYVARDLSFGMPLYRETKCSELEPLVYRIGGSAGRLRYVSSPTAGVCLFRPELEQGDFLRFFLHWEARSWEVFDTTGVRWALGASPDSRDSDGTHIFAWYVKTIQDRRANQITYSYLPQEGVLYPVRIEYDQGASLPAYPTVEFTWKAEQNVCPPSVDVCVDDHRVSYKKGFRANYRLKLTRITVTGDDEYGQPESRSYDLAYEASKSYGKGTKLSGVVTVDATGKVSIGPMRSHMGGHVLRAVRPQESAPGHPSPAAFFQYYDVQENFAQRHEFSHTHDGAAWKQSIHSTRTEVHSHEFRGNLFDVTAKKYLCWYGCWEESDADIMTMSMLVDIDGDGKLDMLFVDAAGSWAFIRNKRGFAFDTTPVKITLPAGLVKTGALELTRSNSRTEWQFIGERPDRPLSTLRTDATVQRVLDMDGDGLADVVFVDGATGKVRVCLGGPDGAGWKFDRCRDWKDWTPAQSETNVLRKTYTELDRAAGIQSVGGDVRQWTSVDLVDMNGDGLLDYVEAGPGRLSVWLNEGTRFASKDYGVTLPKEACSRTGNRCVSDSIGEFNDAYVDVNGRQREMRLSLCKTTALVDLNGDKIPDLVLTQPRVGQVGQCAPKDASAFGYAAGMLGGFDMAHYSTFDLSEGPVMATLPAGTWTDKNGEDGLFIDINGDGLKDYVMLGGRDPDKATLYVRYNTGHGFLPGYGWEVQSPAGDWARVPDVEHLTNADDTFDRGGKGSSYLRRALVDINGDGAVELINIAADVGGKDFWRIYSRSGPAVPLTRMSGSHSDTGMDVRVRYQAVSEDDRSLLPFPKWYVSALQRNDTVTNTALAQEYVASGGYYDAARREFSGFSRVTATEPTRRFEYFFWNANDGANACKRGRLQKIETHNREVPSALLAEDASDYACIRYPAEVRQWARLEKATKHIMDVSPPIVSEVSYEYKGGTPADLGLVNEVRYNAGTPDERRDAYEYCTVNPGSNPGRALARTSKFARKDRDGAHEVIARRYLYDLTDSADGCTGITKGDLSAIGEWRNGGWAMSSLEYDPIGRLSNAVSPDKVAYSFEYYGNTGLLKKRTSIGKADHSVYYSNYHALTGQPQKICGPAHRPGHSPAGDSCTQHSFDKDGRVVSAGQTMSRILSTPSGELMKGPWQNGVVYETEYHDLGSGIAPRFVEGRADPYLGGAIAARPPAPERRREFRHWAQYYSGSGLLVLLEQRFSGNQFFKLYIDYTPLGQIQKTWARILSGTAGYARHTVDAAALQKGYTYEYDALGRLSKITNPDGTSSKLSFKGNLVTYEDERQHHFEAEVNTFGEVIAKRSWTGGSPNKLLESTYAYDAAGQLNRATDPENGVYVYEYSLDGSLKRVKTPVSDWTYEYTQSGRLAKINKSSGAAVGIEYDDRGRISLVKESPGAGCGAGSYREHRYVYDRSPDPAVGSDEEYTGRLTEVKGSEYRVTFGYNAQGAVDRLALYTPTASATPLAWVDRLYLATGEVTQARFSSQQVVTYRYDDVGRLRGLEALGLRRRGAQPDHFTADIEYNGGGQLEKIEGNLTNPAADLGTPGGRPFRFMRKHSYGANGFVSDIETQIPGEGAWRLQQWYEPNGQISRIRDEGLRGLDHTYHYDAANRLVRAEGYDYLADGTKNPSGQIEFQYHRNSALDRVTVPQQLVENYSYDSGKQKLTSRTSPQGTWTYSYDAAGRRCSENSPGEEIDYRWSGGDNLSRVTSKYTGKELQFEYGMGVGRWLANRAGQKTYYLDMLEFVQGQNAYSLHLPLPGGITCTLGPNTCTFFDEHGPAAVFSAAGKLLETSEYLPYGQKHVISGGAGLGFGFAGQGAEELASLSYFGARYYDARARQWTSSDPSLSGAPPASTIFGLSVLQPFVYASADPISKFDWGGDDTAWFSFVESAAQWFVGVGTAAAIERLIATWYLQNQAGGGGKLLAAGLTASAAASVAKMARTGGARIRLFGGWLGGGKLLAAGAARFVSKWLWFVTLYETLEGLEESWRDIAESYERGWYSLHPPGMYHWRDLQSDYLYGFPGMIHAPDFGVLAEPPETVDPWGLDRMTDPNPAGTYIEHLYPPEGSPNWGDPKFRQSEAVQAFAESISNRPRPQESAVPRPSSPGTTPVSRPSAGGFPGDPPYPREGLPGPMPAASGWPWDKPD